MYRQLALALIAAWLSAQVARANFGPPIVPKGQKRVEPQVRFEGTDKHANHVFYVFYSAAYFGYQLAEVKEGEPIKLKFDSFKDSDRYPQYYLELLALERKDFEERKKADPSLKWLGDKKEGAIIAKAEAPKGTVPSHVKDVPVTTYRVTLEVGKLKAGKVEPQKTSAAEPTELLPPWGFGVVMSLSMVWLGLWFARRNTVRGAPN
jgi:hypothetical protein